MESNRIIAEFMGIESYKSTKYTMFVYEENNHRTDVDLHYHTSWDWLMPVVEKIEALKYRVEISHNGCLIESHKDLDTARMNSGIGEIEPTKLKATYKAVVEFINQNN